MNITGNIKLAAVGDMMLGDHPVRLGNGVRSVIERLGTEHLFTHVEPLFRECDIVFGNLEAPHSDMGALPNRLESIEFRGSKESIPVLKKAGFNILNFSNNHCMQHGEKAFWETVNLIRQNGIFPAGVKGDDDRCIPYEFEKNNTRMILLSYSLRAENYHPGKNLPYTFKNEDSIIEEVMYFRDSADFLILSLHWGEEYMDFPSPMQVLFSHKLADAGANLIIGHHPHVLQGVELYRDSLIVYSLGNFVFDMWQKKTRKSAILRVDFSREGIDNFDLIPIYINDTFQPKPMDGKSYEKFLKELANLNQAIKERYLAKDLEADLNAVKKAEKYYQKLAHKRMTKHRLEDYYYFLSHIYQYSPNIIFQSAKRSLLRRMGEIRKSRLRESPLC